jgi:SAM-dependent methyltransferase
VSFETRTRCRSCEAEALETVLDLGPMPLANALVAPDALGPPDPLYPLTLAVCGSCALAQILETVPPQVLFSDYRYFSSYSDTMLEHARESARELIASRKLGPASLVVEVASNDGYQLRYFVEAGIPVLGIEPAANVAAAAEHAGIPTRVEFFGPELARRLVAEGRRADVLLAYNVMAHVPDLNGFVEGIRTLLAPDGVAVIEVPDVGQLVGSCEFDTIYHEHLCYFSVTALRPLFERHDLELIGVDEIPMHGGSFRLYVTATGAARVEPSGARIGQRERERGLTDASAYRGFSQRVEALGGELVDRINGLRARGQRLAAYGAAAKGTTLLNYLGLGAEHLEFVADRSPHKQGRYIPGVRLRIVPPDMLLEARPDYCLLLSWNFADEILDQQRPYRDAGGQFIIPLPKLRVV